MTRSSATGTTAADATAGGRAIAVRGNRVGRDVVPLRGSDFSRDIATQGSAGVSAEPGLPGSRAIRGHAARSRLHFPPAWRGDAGLLDWDSSTLACAMTPIPARAEARRQFVSSMLGSAVRGIEPASADASFRSYWRVTLADGSTRVLMDAPPEREDSRPWLDIGARLRRAALHVPRVDHVDLAQGFILMEDLGTRSYLTQLDAGSADALYADALDALLRMQTHVDTNGLARFDRDFVIGELELMPEWFLRRHLGHEPTCAQWDALEAASTHLVEAILAQPQTFMHRDYHSRNLMVVAPGSTTGDGIHPNPGIIDFQGALVGPVTYDLASLLRDCYIEWDAERIEGWLESHRQRLLDAHQLDEHVDAARLRRWFDLTGLQRHLKVLGIFCRLHYRDGKMQYLADLPLVWRYVLDIARRYRELAPLADLLEAARAGRDLTAPRTDTG